MMKLSKSKGFSLVELMIVVAIMAILAAIAIPSFMRFSMKAKTSEATGNLAAIRVAEESYRAENDVYFACGASPVGQGNDATPDTWVDAGGFGTIGFAPDGQVRYMYTVTINLPANAPSFSATAVSDLDEDGGLATFTVDTTVATFPKAILAPLGEF